MNPSVWKSVLACLMVLPMVWCVPAAATQQDDDLTSGQVPWSTDSTGPQLPAVAQTSPRDALVGVDTSEIDAMIDGIPLDENNETLLKILYRLPQISLGNVERFVETTGEVDLAQLSLEPSTYRTSMFRLSGRARGIEVVRLIPAIAERYDFPGYLRVQVEVDGFDQPVSVITRRVPGQWQVGQDLNEPIEFDGMFLHWEGEEGDQRRLVFAAARLKWHPQEGTPFSEINAGELLLSRNGMDVSMFEEMSVRDRRSLELEDSECFFQMLAAVSRVERGDKTFEPGSSLELFRVLREPDLKRGDRFAIRGNIRRITRVDVTDDYIADRLGIDHYYQIDMFVRLEQNQIVRLKTNDGKEGPAYANKFPITVCVPELPDDLTTTDDVNVQAEMYAHFFKLWAYPSQYVEQFDPDLRQIGPLFVGHEVRVLEQTGSTSMLTWIAGFVLLLSLGGAWWGATMLSRKPSDGYVQPQRQEADAKFLKELQDRP